jgi:hypothetical protein
VKADWLLQQPVCPRFKTSALFLLPNAMQLHNATSTDAARAPLLM